MDGLVIPEADATLNAEEFLENLGLIWEKATLEEKHRLLAGMLHAVYVDLVASRSIIGILPKAPSYPLFESLQHKPESRVIVFNPDGNSDIEKITAPENELQSGEILGGWRRGRDKLPVQKKLFP